MCSVVARSPSARFLFTGSGARPHSSHDFDGKSGEGHVKFDITDKAGDTTLLPNIRSVGLELATYHKQTIFGTAQTSADSLVTFDLVVIVKVSVSCSSITTNYPYRHRTDTPR